MTSEEIVEQYEARLQFAAEFVEPSARLRRLRPDSLVYSYEWFEDDARVLEAIEPFAHLRVTLPHGWTLADPTRVTEAPTKHDPAHWVDADGGTRGPNVPPARQRIDSSVARISVVNR
ncbi:MAG: hypothetical protein ACT4OQ_06965 [Chloroflexota bacterium]